MFWACNINGSVPDTPVEPTDPAQFLGTDRPQSFVRDAEPYIDHRPLPRGACCAPPAGLSFLRRGCGGSVFAAVSTPRSSGRRQAHRGAIKSALKPKRE